jgi:hypothetical protein
MEIKMLKLLSGEEILCGIVADTDSHVEVENPVVVIPTQQDNGSTSVALAAFPMFAHRDQKTLKIRKSVVVLEPYDAPDNFVNQWRQIYGSGIVVPSIQLSKK